MDNPDNILLGFNDETNQNGYYTAALTPRIGVCVYSIGRECFAAQLYPLIPNVEIQEKVLFFPPNYACYVTYVVGSAKSPVMADRYPYIHAVPDLLTIKCLILEALPIAEKKYADQNFPADPTARKDVE